MNIRRFKQLHATGMTYAEIGRECGCDWRTVRKYLAEDAPTAPPSAPSRKGTQKASITEMIAALIDAMLRACIDIKATVICERLADEHDVHVHYQRVKTYCRSRRPQIRAELGLDEPGAGSLHRRFATLPGAQAQVDWGDEGDLFGTGVRVYSFHMTLSYSRDPFCCFVTSMDAATFFDCHRRAFDHFGGVPAAIVYDRLKTVVRRHVAPGKAVPVTAAATAFAGHYGYDIDVLAAYRPTGKGRVERQVDIVREHVVAGRRFRSVGDADAAFARWVKIRRGQVHRTHGQVIAEAAAVDHAALGPLPATEYAIFDEHVRTVGKDCLISFESDHYSIPASQVTARQKVLVRATANRITICRLEDPAQVLAVHRRGGRSHEWIIDPTHWDGLPDGAGRAICHTDPDQTGASASPEESSSVLARYLASIDPVPDIRRPLASYELVAGEAS